MEATSHDQEALAEFLLRANDDVGQAMSLLRAVPQRSVFSAHALEQDTIQERRWEAGYPGVRVSVSMHSL